MLISELAFNRPGAVASEVTRIMDRCIREVGSGDEQRDTIVDNMVQDTLVVSMLPVVIQDLFESGHMVVPGTQSRLTVPWVAAHLTDVLTIAGLIPEYAIDGMPDGGSSSAGSLRGHLRTGVAVAGVVALALGSLSLAMLVPIAGVAASLEISV